MTYEPNGNNTGGKADEEKKDGNGENEGTHEAGNK